MQLLERLFQIISSVIPSPGLSTREADLLSRLNPEKFYVENVRSLLNVSHASAVRICETAVRQGLFDRRIEVRCPDGVVAASADSEGNLPVTVKCRHEEDGHFAIEELQTVTLEKSVFYRLHDDTESYARSA
jgi:hypothetical protein